MRIASTIVLLILVTAPLIAQSIPFEVCTESTTWVRPSPEVQAKIWNDGRYRDFGRTDYAWTHDFIVIDDPLSASVPYHLRNLSGLWTDPQPFNKCDTDQNNRHNGGEWIEVWSMLHRVKEVRHDNNTYTFTVERADAGFQQIYVQRMNPSVVLRFVTPDGTELERCDESAPPNRVKNTVPLGTVLPAVVPTRR
jgi:hypothetical protein